MAELHYELLDAAREYQMPAAAIEVLSQNPPLIITAITAAGKTTIAHRIIEKSEYQQVVTHTTRAQRDDETNGVDYWFVSEGEMLDLIKSGAFVEVQPIHSDTVYGTSIGSYKAVVENGRRPFLVIDVQGVNEIVTGVPEVKPFFVLPPNYEAWVERLARRGAMSHIEKSRRLDSARQEIQTVLNDPHYVLVVNDDVERVAQEILAGPTMVSQNKYRQIAQNLIDNIKI